MGLLLQAVDVAGPLRWRWLLTDQQTGTALADHQVDLDPASDEVARFNDLYGYARWHASPDRRAADEARIVAEAGSWVGRVLLGEAVGTAIADAAPVTVRVAVPAEAEPALLWPLELAHAGGRPLAARGDVTLVYDVDPNGTRHSKDAMSGALRMLAVFSQPTQTSVVALRRARYELGRLIRRIARQRGKVELRVVQYGVTRELLAEIADSGDGWDVLHLSGHGGRGLFVLEHADGSPDPVNAVDLVELLHPLRRRVKLAVVSACQSAADVTAETLRLVGLEDQARQVEEGDAAPVGPPKPEVTGVARTLVAELDCAVVAMRYPVTDEFAIAFGDLFYEHLLGRGHPVDVAVARAVAGAAGRVDGVAGTVALATPGVFGARAAQTRPLALEVPRGAPLLDPAAAAMAYFLPEPERFVGRAVAMAKASTALAPRSGRTTVLLHGMAGAGKTACALELAYRHHDGFAAAAFWQAPTRDDEFAGALGRLAESLEIQLGGYGFTMTGHIATVATLEASLPRLRQVLEDNGVLLVLDNLETLLTPEGTWRDPRWKPLVGALAGHDGESRLVLTSRVPPAGLTGLGLKVLTLPVHSLSLDEAAVLARELPNLRGLLYADTGSGRAQANVAQDRERVRRVLRVVQGHPKLLELADAAATDPDRLDAQLVAAESAATGQELEAFFRDGVSALDPGQFLAALTGWTTNALTVLPPPARLLAEFLVCLEDDDRKSDVIEATWGNLWRRLDRPGDAPEPGPLLGKLTAAALVQPDATAVPSEAAQQRAGSATPSAGPAPTDPAEPAAPPRLTAYRVHPGVAAAISAAATPGIHDAADTELATFWQAAAGQAREREGGEDGGMVVRAGLAAAPYLLRRRDWAAASTLLEHAILRNESPGVIQGALPALHHIAATTGTPKDQFVLARALRTVDPAQAETLLRDALRRAADGGDYKLASAIAGGLANLLSVTGRLREALDLTGQKASYTRQAGLGSWTQLADEARRLQILSVMGEHEQVLAETAALRTRMSELSAAVPAGPTGDEAVNPWNVREVILDTGHTSALALGRWQQCLDLTAEIHASERLRGTGLHEVTCTRFNDAGPLIRLGRLPDADRLLRECQHVFEDQRDITMLAMVLSTRAHLEDELGHQAAAVDLARTAIRIRYARPEPRDIAISHNNLAFYLRAADADPGEQRAHRLAAALIRQLTSMTYALASTQRALAAELRDPCGPGPLPATLAEVIRAAEQTDGVRLAELITALQPDAQAAEEALAQILRTAADLYPSE